VKSLGRGLAALIPDSALDTGAPAKERPTLRLVPIDEIRANPHQPREVFDPAELSALSESIRAHGILSPLLCRREEGRYVLIAGERRLRAAALAGLTEVPVVLKEADEASTQLELALVENLQRTDLDPLEAARGYQKLMDDYGYTQDEVARRVGKERPTVANALRLLKLPAFVQDAVRDGRITAGHARAMLPLSDAEELRRLVARIVAQGLSVRSVEKIVAQLVKPASRATGKDRRDRTWEYATKVLSESLHATVAIKGRKDGSGTIVIDYSDTEHLDRLIEQLRAGR
jgi:ParB family chromosome partitioning protein